MMVEAESTKQTLTLLAAAAAARAARWHRQRRRWRRAWRRPSRSSGCSARRRRSRRGARGEADGRTSPSSWTTSRTSTRARRGGPRRARAGADHRGQAAARGRDRPGQGPGRGEAPGGIEGREKEIGHAFRALTKKLVRERIVARRRAHRRARGWPTSGLTAEVEVVPRVHGSALFERGETQVLGVTTLNMLRMEQMHRHAQPG